MSYHVNFITFLYFRSIDTIALNGGVGCGIFWDQPSGTLSHWLVPYKEERGKVSFQCGTLKPKKDYKCNTWSLRQKLLLQF